VDHDGFITPEDLVAAARVANHGACARAPTWAGARVVRGWHAGVHEEARRSLLPRTTPLRLHRTGTPAAAGGSGQGASAGQPEESVSAALHQVVHEALGERLTLAEAQQMLNEVDEKHQGRISLQEVRARARLLCLFHAWCARARQCCGPSPTCCCCHHCQPDVAATIATLVAAVHQPCHGPRRRQVAAQA
jgi:hypothetical protein